MLGGRYTGRVWEVNIADGRTDADTSGTVRGTHIRGAPRPDGKVG